jgi:hypothetical protein
MLSRNNGEEMIEQPQLSYFIEFMSALGDAAENFVLVGAQAMRFWHKNVRYTKDTDLVLGAHKLKKSDVKIAEVLDALNYEVVQEAQRFQFIKKIPGSKEKMRLEFLASDQGVIPDGFRVKIQEDIHAHTCLGAEVAIKESELKTITGPLPDGTITTIKIRVAKPYALLMLKLFAMDDRNKNIRGPKESEHDRERARVHAADVIQLVSDNIKNPEFTEKFWKQFGDDVGLEERIENIFSKYYENLNSPGIQLYREFLSSQGLSVDEEIINGKLREIKYMMSKISTNNS